MKELPGFDLTEGWARTIPEPWAVAYFTFDQIGTHRAWGIKLENQNTGQYTLGHFDPSATEALRRAVEEAQLIKPPSYKAKPTFTPPPVPTIDSLLGGL